jgi:thioredoxin reductase (NADPH)
MASHRVAPRDTGEQMAEADLAAAVIENVIVIGSGPAGYTAALYTSRANLNPLVIEGFAWGGLLQQTTDVENYPGFPEGVMGPEMMQKFRDQAERFGARLITDQAERVELADEPGGVHKVWVGDTEYRARTVVLAMGAEHKKLEVPGELELSGRGVSYCATCDAAFFRNAPTIIVGGGDSAMEEAIFLSKFASKVVIVHRRSEFRASKIMLDRARAQENIEFLTPYTVKEFLPAEGGTALGRAVLLHAETGQERELDISGAFIAVGHEPQSTLVNGQIDVDDEGYVLTQPRSTRTNRPGVFAAGDLVDRTYRQAITAAGSGCEAALDAEWYLRDTPEVPTPEGMPLGDLAEAQWAPVADGAS